MVPLSRRDGFRGDRGHPGTLGVRMTRMNAAAAPVRPRRRTVRTLATAVLAALAVGALGGGTAVAAPSARPQHVLVVATTGDDGAAGTVRHPLATVAAAVRRLPAGGTVLLRGGRYAERVSLGAGVHDLTIRPYGHEHPVLDGAGLVVPDGRSAMVDGRRQPAESRSRGSRSPATGRRRWTRCRSAIYVHGAAQRRHAARQPRPRAWATTTRRSAATTSTRTASPSTATRSSTRSPGWRSRATRSTTSCSARASRSSSTATSTAGA